MIPTLWIKPLLYALAVAAVAGGLWWLHHHIYRQGYDAAMVEFNAFKDKVAAAGKVAQALADAQSKRDKENMEKANADHAKVMADFNARIARMRDTSNTRSYSLPAAAATSIRPDLACFQRADFERESRELIEQLRSGIRGLADEASAATLDLDNAKVWAQRK